MTLKLDDASVKFVASWIVPLVKRCAHRKCPSQETLGPATSTASSQDDLSGFQVRETETPNVRDKVCWSVTAHKWTVMLKNARSPLLEQFAVDPALDPKAYEEQKVATYWRAVDAWSRLEGSSRLRVPKTCLTASSAD